MPRLCELIKLLNLLHFSSLGSSLRGRRLDADANRFYALRQRASTSPRPPRLYPRKLAPFSRPRVSWELPSVSPCAGRTELVYLHVGELVDAAKRSAAFAGRQRWKRAFHERNIVAVERIGRRHFSRDHCRERQQALGPSTEHGMGQHGRV